MKNKKIKVAECTPEKLGDPSKNTLVDTEGYISPKTKFRQILDGTLSVEPSYEDDNIDSMHDSFDEDDALMRNHRLALEIEEKRNEERAAQAEAFKKQIIDDHERSKAKASSSDGSAVVNSAGAANGTPAE